jgi:nucleotide-binding universal stress UspA family protein
MLKTILAAVDERPGAERVTDLVAELATATGASVTVVHYIETAAGSYGDRAKTETLGEAATIVERHCRRLRDAGVAATARLDQVRAGQVTPALVKAADELDAGLIVVGAGSHAELVPAMLGAVPDRLLHQTRKSVLVAR